MKMSGEPRSTARLGVVVDVLVVAAGDGGGHDQGPGQGDGELGERVAHGHVGHGALVAVAGLTGPPPARRGSAAAVGGSGRPGSPPCGPAGRSGRRASARSACPRGSSGGWGTRCRPPCPPWRCWVACTTRWPASEAHHLATATASAAGRPVSMLPGRLPEGDADGLGVDVGVGRPEHGPLEGGRGAAELVAFVQVGGGPADGLLGHPQLDGAEADAGPLEHPRHRRGAVGRARPGRRRPPPGAVEMDVGMDLAVGGGGPLQAAPGPRRGRRGTTVTRRPSVAAGTRTRSARWAWGTARVVPCEDASRRPSADGAIEAGRRCALGGHLGQRGGRGGRRRPPRRGASGPSGAGVPKLGQRAAPRARWWPTAGTGATARPCCSRTRQTSVRPEARSAVRPRGRPGPAGSAGPGRPTARRRRGRRSFSTSATRAGVAMPSKTAGGRLGHRRPALR